jgi:hypothetical protein
MPQRPNDFVGAITNLDGGSPQVIASVGDWREGKLW